MYQQIHLILLEEHQKQIESGQNVEKKKLEILRQRHRPTYDAVMWYKDNKAKFKGQVHLPLIMSMSHLHLHGL